MKKTLLAGLLLCSFSLVAQKTEHTPFLIKFTPTQLVMGEINFSYEHRVFNQGTVEVNVGPTISQVGLPPLLFFDELGIADEQRISDLGGFISAGFRYYPLSQYSWAPRGLYFGPELKYRHYNVKYSANGQGTSDEKGYVSQFMFKFQIGYQFVTNGGFALDLFGGIGFSKRTIQDYYLTGYYEGNDYVQYWQSDNSSKIGLVGQIGLKIGFGRRAQ